MRFVALFLLGTTLLSAVEVVEECCTLEILTPSMQNVEQRKLRLDNGLEAYLISDPDAPESGAALSVEVGSWQDPKDFPGQAHFTEHLVFLGNEKYPEENNLRRFLDDHGGRSNAYTATEVTNYMFAVNNNAIEEALGRLAAMFIGPRFAASSMAREIHAVDQEFARANENDMWRTELVMRETNNPAHPDSSFGMGNLKTLGALTPEQAKSWFEKHYSANLMHLVVYSPLSLDQMQEMVVRDFGAIPDRHLGPFTSQGRRRSARTRDHILTIEPYQEAHQLLLSWELPYDYENERETHTPSLLAFALGHEGEGSVLAALKAEGLAEGLGAGGQIQRKSETPFYSFEVRVYLTPEGVRRHEEVAMRLFEAIKVIQEEGIPAYAFDEVQTLNRLSYNYQTRTDAFNLVSHHARALTQEPLATYPEKSIVASTYDPEAIATMAKQLTPSGAHLTLVAPRELTGVEPTTEEKQMGVAYSLVALPSDAMRKLDGVQLNDAIHPPKPNPYIPDSLTLTQAATPVDVTRPIEIQDDDWGRLYYSADHQYQLPEVAYRFHIKSQALEKADAEDAALLDLYVRSVTEELNKESYAAALAGLSYDISPAFAGIILTIDGYSDKAPLLLNRIVTSLTTGLPTEVQFDTYKESLATSYANAAKGTPIQQAGGVIKEVLYRYSSTAEDKERALEEITYDDFSEFFTDFREETYVEGVLYGNLTETQAKSIATSIQSKFQQEPFEKGRGLRPRIVKFPKSRGPFIVTKQTTTPGNAAVLIVDEGAFTFKRRAAQQILSSGIEEPFFSNLRTKQQTGYVCWSWDQEIEHLLFQFFAVESKSHDGRDLLARFEMLIEGFLHNLKSDDLPEERFEKLKAALVHKLDQPPKNPSEMASRLFDLAFHHRGDFSFIQRRIEGFNQLTYPEFLVLADEFLGKANKQRLAILIQGTMPPETTLRYSPARSPKKFKRVSQARGSID